MDTDKIIHNLLLPDVDVSPELNLDMGRNYITGSSRPHFFPDKEIRMGPDP
jgi:hypothetical protein